MSLLTGTGIGRYYGAQDVFVDLAFSIEHGDRIGLVGANGEGKTTLLRLLADIDTPDSGQLFRKRDLRLGYLPQDPADETRNTPLWDHMLTAFTELRALEEQLAAEARRLEVKPGSGRASPCGPGVGDDGALERYSALQGEFERREGYTYEHRIRTVLHGLGFSRAQYARPLSQLSGGQRTRALLAHMLLEDADLLLLDEPTNYLDLNAVEWLESWLGEFSGSLLVVSHDRYFLDAVTRRTWEIAFRKLEAYRGNYSAYVRQRQERYERRLKEWRTQQDYVAKTEDFIHRFMAGQRTKEAQGRRTRLKRYLSQEGVDKPQDHQRLHLRLGEVERSGDIALRLSDLQAGYDAGTPVLRIPSLEVRRGQRIAVVGGNGTGKTTLVRTILGDLPALSGQVRPGAKIEMGYLPQAHDYLDPARTVIDTVAEMRPQALPAELRHHLGSFLFSGDDVFKRIDQLSGGERSRVALARLVLTEANLLVLDEPTNHLDIMSQEVLEDVLSEYEGTLILVSHDRYLIQALGEIIWTVADGTVSSFRGSWVEFAASREAAAHALAEAGDAEVADAGTQRERSREERRQRKHREQLSRRHDELEESIAAREEQLRLLGEDIGRAGEESAVDRVQELVKEYQALEGRLVEAWAEWEAVAQELEDDV